MLLDAQFGLHLGGDVLGTIAGVEQCGRVVDEGVSSLGTDGLDGVLQLLLDGCEQLLLLFLLLHCYYYSQANMFPKHALRKASKEESKFHF